MFVSYRGLPSLVLSRRSLSPVCWIPLCLTLSHGVIASLMIAHDRVCGIPLSHGAREHVQIVRVKLSHKSQQKVIKAPSAASDARRTQEPPPDA